MGTLDPETIKALITAGTAFPANITLLGHVATKTNNATALAVGLDVGTIYIETEN